MKSKNAILILAAGQSSRMKKCKFEIRIGNKSLLANTVDEAVSASDEVVVVSGAFPRIVDDILAHKQVNIIYNPEFRSGIASSIQSGFNFIAKNLSVDNILISVSDQPFINNAIFLRLIEANAKNPDHIIVSEYGSTFGVPCLFPMKYWHLIDEISGDSGAKKILGKYEKLLIKVSFDKGEIDLDTPEDLESLTLKK